MEKRIDVTSSMPDGCEYCGKTHEEDGRLIDLRPYGKNGAWVCFECGMLPDNIATTEQMFSSILDSNEVVITGDRKDKRKLN